ncbi:MAG: lipoprotein signal peptidase [bacterium]|nr:lipoprotein signal peptidase [bacterium]
MTEAQKTLIKYFLIAIAVIAIDQTVKLLVHFNMEMGSRGQIQLLGDFFKLHYLTNKGMAFGLQFGFSNGKVILTMLRLLAMVGISYYLYWLIKKESPKGLLLSMALILGGAIGNVIDSIFYGVFLNNAPAEASSPWFQGQVIDMFYFDLWEGRIADWVPLVGNEYVALWPVFNVADASIFVGISIILIFQRTFFQVGKEEHDEDLPAQQPTESVNPEA